MPSQKLGTKLEFKEMANHKSSIKRIRSNDAKRTENRYYAKTTRNAVNKLRTTTSKKEAQDLLPKVSSMLDKLAKKALFIRIKQVTLSQNWLKKLLLLNNF